VNVCSGYPSLAEVPLVWQSLVPPRPVGTCLVSDASLAPLCPGSRKTIIPAMLVGAATAFSATGVDAARRRPTAIAAPTRRLSGTYTAPR